MVYCTENWTVLKMYVKITGHQIIEAKTDWHSIFIFVDFMPANNKAERQVSKNIDDLIVILLSLPFRECTLLEDRFS